MPTIKSDQGEKEALLQVSRLMLVSARTAPKTGGIDDILTIVVFGKEKETLAEEMRKIGE